MATKTFDTTILECAKFNGWECSRETTNFDSGTVAMRRITKSGTEFGIYDFKSSPPKFIVSRVIEHELTAENYGKIFE